MKKPKIKYQISNTRIKTAKIFTFLTCVFYFLSFSFYFNEVVALTVNGNELVKNAHLYDGKIIEYQGEVIGDIMVRGRHVWLNVNDGTCAIGIWAEKSLVQNIKHTGDYNYIGDTIKVRGIFHRACPEHGGDLDIHAHEISIIEEGYKVEHPINPIKVVVAVILFMAVLMVIFYPKFLKRRS